MQQITTKNDREIDYENQQFLARRSLGQVTKTRLFSGETYFISGSNSIHLMYIPSILLSSAGGAS